MDVTQKIRLSGLQVIVTSLSFQTAVAQDNSQMEVEAFYGMCLYPEAPFEDVSRNASAAGYPELPENVLTMLLPPEEPLEIKGWMVLPEDGIEKAIVVVSKNIIEGDAAQTCGLILGNTDAHQTLALFEELLNPQLIDRDSDGIGTYSYYELTIAGQKKIVTASHRSADDARELNLSVMVYDD